MSLRGPVLTLTSRREAPRLMGRMGRSSKVSFNFLHTFWAFRKCIYEACQDFCTQKPLISFLFLLKISCFFSIFLSLFWLNWPFLLSEFYDGANCTFLLLEFCYLKIKKLMYHSENKRFWLRCTKLKLLLSTLWHLKYYFEDFNAQMMISNVFNELESFT